MTLQQAFQNDIAMIRTLFLERILSILEELPPLHAAAKIDYEHVVKAILDINLCDIDSKDHLGRTALDIACEHGHHEVVKTLLKYGCDVNITSNGKIAVETLDMGMFISAVKGQYGFDQCYGFLEEHVIKLITANLYVSPRYLVAFDIGHEKFEEECEVEVDQMEIEMIGDTDISYFKILTKDANSLAMLMKREDIVQASESDDYKTKFPRYADMINNQFRKGKWRNELLECGYKMFPSLFKHLPELPVECAEEVLSNLSNEQLRVFNGCV